MRITWSAEGVTSMVGVQQSLAQGTVQFSASPADVAAAAEQALASVGDVTKVDAPTGRIEGKVKKGMHGWDSTAHIEMLISASGGGTQVQIQTSRDEGAISMHGAEKAMDIILAAFQEQSVLAQSSTSGWSTTPPAGAGT